MKICWITDPHLNFVSPDHVLEFAAKATQTNADMIVITGDISEAPSLEAHLNIFEAATLIPTYYVLGNHDFYRGSIKQVKANTHKASVAREKVKWLTTLDVVSFGPNVALIGNDGWYDGKNGNYWKSTVYLADFDWIEDFEGLDRNARLGRFYSMSAEAAVDVEIKLVKALEAGYKTVVFATHVAPYAEAAWHMGKMSDPDFLPFFSCKTMGDMLSRIMAKYPDQKLQVLCGHSHSGGEIYPLPNITVTTGSAKYGSPSFKVIEI